MFSTFNTYNSQFNHSLHKILNIELILNNTFDDFTISGSSIFTPSLDGTGTLVSQSISPWTFLYTGSPGGAIGLLNGSSNNVYGQIYVVPDPVNINTPISTPITPNGYYYMMFAQYTTTTRTLTDYLSQYISLPVGTYTFSMWLIPRKQYYSARQSVNVSIGGTQLTLVNTDSYSTISIINSKSSITFPSNITDPLKTSCIDAPSNIPWTKFTGTYNCTSASSKQLLINFVYNATYTTNNTTADNNSTLYISTVSLKRTA